MKTKLRIIVFSLLSDIQVFENNDDVNDVRINYIKFLLLKYPDTTIEIDPDFEYELFETNQKSK